VKLSTSVLTKVTRQLGRSIKLTRVRHMAALAIGQAAPESDSRVSLELQTDATYVVIGP
jgi:hypothetical protein